MPNEFEAGQKALRRSAAFMEEEKLDLDDRVCDLEEKLKPATADRSTVLRHLQEETHSLRRKLCDLENTVHDLKAMKADVPAVIVNELNLSLKEKKK
jgi:hypothetical protein